MSVPIIPRKPVGEPAHLKEVNTTNTTSTSAWDIPEQRQQKQSKFGFGMSGTAGKWALSDRLDRLLPPHRRYFGRSRRTLLIVIGVLLVCLLALIIGLAAGLSSRSDKTQNLPLPGGAETYSGELTYYSPALGACGVDSDENDAIVSVSHFTFDAVQTGSDPNQNPLCGRKIRARRVNEKTGKSVSIDVTVVDRCTGCQPTDLDVSPAMFNRMADPDLGRVPVTWAWL